MIVTAKEATTKLMCCMSHARVNETQIQTMHCLGPKCMAWRWKDLPWNGLSVVYRCLCCKTNNPKEYDENERRGYCGLAGAVK